MFSFYSDVYPEVELLDHMLVIFLNFLGNSRLFSIVDTKFFKNNFIEVCFIHDKIHPFWVYNQ